MVAGCTFQVSPFVVQALACRARRATCRAARAKQRKKRQKSTKNGNFLAFQPENGPFSGNFQFFSLKSAFFGIHGAKHARLAVRGRLKLGQRTGRLTPVQRTGRLTPVQRTGRLTPVQ
ncbi:MAG: hypothetical protein EOM20_03845 [Spartobacteria bacterium]|nr:hypothetical protein [Spartobacteria bacterium]